MRGQCSDIHQSGGISVLCREEVREGECIPNCRKDLLIGLLVVAMITPILADSTTSISELKKNPMAVVDGADGFPVAVLNRISLLSTVCQRLLTRR